MTEVQIAWMAGLLEGEGCWLINHTKKWSSPRILLQMTDEDVVRKAARITGVGKVGGPYGPYKNSLGTKSWFKWDVNKRVDVEYLSGLVLPHMGTRRTAKILEVLSCGM